LSALKLFLLKKSVFIFKVYELVNEYSTFSQQLRKYIDTDFEFNGWVSILTENWNSSSPMYIKVWFLGIFF